MSLVTKLQFWILSVVILIMISMGTYSVQQSQAMAQHQLTQLLQSNLGFGFDMLQQKMQHMLNTAEIIAQSPEISKSLHKDINRGLSQRLNKLVKLYPHINYLLIIDKQYGVFSANTRNRKDHRINGEQLLGIDVRQNPLFVVPELKRAVTGTPQTDPYLSLLAPDNKTNNIDQWIISPVTNRGKVLGWVVVSFAWQDASQLVLKQLIEQLQRLHSPTKTALLTQLNGDILISSESGLATATFTPTDNILWQEKLVNFGQLEAKMILVNDKKLTQAPLLETKNKLLGILIGGTITLIICLYLILQQYLLKRINVLYQGALEIDSGQEFAHLPDLGKDELGKLGKAFNRLSVNLRQSILLLEKEKRFLDEKVKVRTSELERARQDAESSTKAKSEFLAAMSHEIRTPMNGVLGMAQLLKSTNLTQQQVGYIDILYNSGSALLIIINDILDISKIEAGRLTLEPIPFDLERAAYDVCQILSSQANEKGIELILHYDINCPTYLKGDPGRIRQILLNLTGNAIKFTHTGQIILKISALGRENQVSKLSIKVIDSGIGIDKDVQNTLFTSFTQADSSTTRKYGGTGLGLAICKHLVKLMEGEIGVDSQPGVGSTFWINISLPELQRPIAIPQADLTNIRTLIVDDNSLNLQILENMLEKMHMQVTSTSKADQVVDLLLASQQDQPYQLLLADLQMNGINGEQLTQQIRQTKSISKIPIIILSSSGQRGDAKRLKAHGVNSFIVKPLLTDILRQTLTSVLGMAEQSNGSEQPFVTTHDVIEAQQHNNQQSLQLTGKVLLAEDVVTNQIVAKTMLEMLGLCVEIANDGEEAYSKWKKSKYDLILMDCQMPKLDGYAATVAIREEEELLQLSYTPIIALTANALDTDKQKCLDKGMDDFLAKPFQQNELTKMLSQWLDRQTTPLAGPQASPQAAPQKPALTVSHVQIKVFDTLKNAIGENFNDLLKAYSTDLEEFTGKFTTAVLSGKNEEVEILVHNMKSSGGNFGFNQLVEQCKQVEHGLRDHQRQPSQQQQDELLDECAYVQTWLASKTNMPKGVV